MTTKRDHLFPATSIGRSGTLARTPSSESLTAHPLLSPGSSPSSIALDTTQGQRYVPYTPRQRATAASTGTVNVSSSPSSSGGDATSRLQMMNLKSAAQGIGLDAGSVGWAILEKLVEGPGDEWVEIWNVITTHKVSTLFLDVGRKLTITYRRHCCCHWNRSPPTKRYLPTL